MMKFILAIVLWLTSVVGNAQVIADFSIPDTVCMNAPVQITNNSIGATTYFWNFCTANLANAPSVSNLNISGANFNWPVFMDYVYDNGNYYGFVTNYIGGNLVRLDFGNSLLNTPTGTNLGNFGGIIPASIGTEGIQVVKQNGQWFAIIVGGNAALTDKPRILKIAFGANITNPAPVATNWGNLGNMDQPVDLHLYEDAGHWFGFTLNAEANTVTRFDFTNSFNNIPTGTSLGNLGSLSYPTGIYVTQEAGSWYAFIVNGGDNSRNNAFNSSLTRLDFGNSLNNMPTGVNLGNPGGLLNHPRDLTIMKSCEQIIGFAVNAGNNDANIVRMDFNNLLTSTPAGSVAANLGNGTFPHCISKLFRDKSDVYGFVANVGTGSLMRLRFPGCSNSNISSGTAKDPLPVTYDAPGTYNINLTIDDGLPTQQMVCKKVVVLPSYISDFNYEQDICDPLSVKFINTNPAIPAPYWIFGDGNINSTTFTPTHHYAAFGNYTVRFAVAQDKFKCSDTITKVISLSVDKKDIVLTPDTVICKGSTKQLRAKDGLAYCWTPNLYLSNASDANPITSTPVDITYYCTSLIRGANLVVNGDFSAGNTGFISDYLYALPPNMHESEYFVGPSAPIWHPGMSDCPDHTGNNGNMMLVNGATVPNVRVWAQTITVKPNTNYEFSAWVQTLNNASPADLRFSINGQPLGPPLVSGAACDWKQCFATWNSGNQTSVTITLNNMSLSYAGNDFGLDDISFSEVRIQRDSVKISIDTPDVNTRTDTTLCHKGSVKLSTSGANTWSWTPATGLSDPNIADPIATPAITTEYEVAGTNQYGCVAKDTVLITVIPPLPLDITPDTTVCTNIPVQLRAFSAGNPIYHWSPAANLNNPGIPNPVASPKSPTKYYVDLTDNNNCITSDSIMVDIVPRPAFTAKGAAAVCYDTETKLEASGGDNYLWSPSDYLDDPQSATPIVKPRSAVSYNVYISENTCGYDTLVQFAPMVVNPLPIVTAMKETDINCVIRSAQLRAGGANSYSWTPASALDNPYRRDPVAIVDSSTQFIVTGINRYGCESSDTLVVNVTKTGTPVFEVPNAFTPNGDGKNDCFGIKKWGVVKLESLEVYNRWGQKIFQTNKPNDCWDGTFQGKPQGAGEFVYIIRASTFCGPILRKGVFFLIR
ncbi:MAG: gliding motility-associated C-terminal domain-containing protein [Chitinophagaceae bacterium]|nr:gliding motility-associated C-terminal domain-containing protein [Chitinophagaceae bacterium]